MTDEQLSTEVAPEESPKGPNVLLISIIVILIVICCCCIGVLVTLYFLGDTILEFIRHIFYQYGIYFQA